jgi:hypothetical protein
MEAADEWKTFVARLAYLRQQYTPFPWINPNPEAPRLAKHYSNLNELTPADMVDNGRQYAPLFIRQLMDEFYHAHELQSAEFFQQVKLEGNWSPDSRGATDENYAVFFLSRMYNLRNYADILFNDKPEVPKTLDGRELYAIGDDGDRVILLRSLSIALDQAIWLGRSELTGREIVIKWIPENPSEISWTFKRLQFAASLQIAQPWWSASYGFWGIEILAMERLYRLDNTDDYAEVGVQILDALQKLNGHACHSDIKPDNILKRLDKTYFLMDWDHISDEPYLYGFERRAFSPSWTSQVAVIHQVTTIKYDLLELGFTMHSLMQGFMEKFTGPSEIKFNVRDIPKPPSYSYDREPYPLRLYQYQDYVKALDERRVTTEDFQALLNILHRVPLGVAYHR